ncbi:hypothetical protein C2845_PM14G07150 [Panicum miliaceum]|uniref:Ubiquitin-like protease family profile domain-containing protein n=1 Tax=Panicum miliaceum TaxID=4540 RepID=A0A3L6PR32_PANMI|nr:hypothetical protein C2845_PM14G07150 [Panicum miliaceum]
MVIELGKNRGIHVTPFTVKQVLSITDSGEDLPLQTNSHASKAFSNFKIMVGLEESQDLHVSHLQKILKDDTELDSDLIEDEMAIRFFFIIACNKLLFHSTDNNIGCKDVYLMRDLSRLSDMNWCKAVVDDLRYAAHAYHIDKTKKGTPSLPGCAILLIIFYLDNLQCKHKIEHMNTPRAQYFDQNFVQKITSADRTKDQQGKATFGLLPLKSSINTCYYTTHHPFSDVPANNEPLAASHVPSILAELGGFVDQIGSRTRQSQARAAMAKFHAKSKKASSYMNMGQLMLQNAHQDVIQNLRAILQDEVRGNIGQDHHHQPIASDTGGHPNQDRPMQLEQNGAQEPTLSSPTALHHIHDETFPRTDNVDYDKDMEDEPSLVCSQLVTEEHYSIYCINFIHDLIDVLDSSPEDHTDYHQILGDQTIRRLNLLFQLTTDYTIKQFTRFKCPNIDSRDNDCGFFAIKFMELWNGESFHIPILTENKYRSQHLFYGIYHPINEVKKLPAGLEAHRPCL